MKFLIVFSALIAVTFASLADDVKPVLGALAPVTAGLGAGLQQGAGNVKAALQNAGAALAQAANGVADVGANTVAGVGQTAAHAPQAILDTVRALEHGGGPLGDLFGVLFG